MLNLFFQELLSALPNIIWAIIILFLGLFISSKVYSFVCTYSEKLKLNQTLKSLGWQGFFDRFNTKPNISNFFGLIVQVYVLLLFIMTSLEILSLNTINNIVGEIVRYYPNIFISMIIFTFALFLADFSKKIVICNLEKEKITYSNLLGNTIAAATWILSILAIMYQLQVVQDLILIVFIGFISLIVITLGISFGIGGKDAAAKILKDLESKIK
jgi:hypothetical protein